MHIWGLFFLLIRMKKTKIKRKGTRMCAFNFCRIFKLLNEVSDTNEVQDTIETDENNGNNEKHHSSGLGVSIFVLKCKNQHTDGPSKQQNTNVKEDSSNNIEKFVHQCTTTSDTSINAHRHSSCSKCSQCHCFLLASGCNTCHLVFCFAKKFFHFMYSFQFVFK